MFKEKFIESFRKAMKEPGAPGQSKLARQIGVSPGHITGLLKGRTAGTEETRRKIAAVLGKSYEEMAGLEVASINLREWRLPRLNLAQYAGVECEVIMVPVVSLGAALRGYVTRVNGELFGWVGVCAKNVRRGDGLVAVEMPDDSMKDMVPKQSLLIVDLLDTDAEETEFCLVGAPSKYPVRQVFWQEDMLILSSCDHRIAPQVLRHTDYARIICGKVAAVYEPGSFEYKNGDIYFNKS